MRLLKKDGYCAPYALRYISGLPEDVVLDVCSHYDWKQKWGMEEHEIVAAASALKMRFRRINLKRTGFYGEKLSVFCRAHNTGVFLVWTSGHILVVQNGVIIDPINEGYVGKDRAVTAALKFFK